MRFLHSSSIRVAALLLLFPASLFAQTVTAPSGTVTVPTSGDFFASAFQNPIDMNDRTDIGWFAWGNDQPHANLSGLTISSGILTGTASSNDPNIYLLDTGNPVSVVRGRRGDVQPIDAARYRTLAIRMRLSGTQGARSSDGQVMDAENDLRQHARGRQLRGLRRLADLLLDIPTLGAAAGGRRDRSDRCARSHRRRARDRHRLGAAGVERHAGHAHDHLGGGAPWTSSSTTTRRKPTARRPIAKNGTTLSKGVTGGSFAFQRRASADYYAGIRAADRRRL